MANTRGLFTLVSVLLALNVCCIFLFHRKLSQLDGTHNALTNMQSRPTRVSLATTAPSNTVIQYFNEAGVKLNEDDLRSLPSWSEIESVIGKEPIILGLNKCEVYRSKTPPLRRMLGASGMFNSGTNLVSQKYQF